MKLSVIIACYNGADTIGAQLEALANQEWSGPWEVIVADNGSTDKTKEVVAHYKPRFTELRIVDASIRRGKSYALNVACREAMGDALLFCDADDEAAPGWLSAMGEALTKHDFIAGRWETDKLNGPEIRSSRKNPQSDGLQTLRFPPYAPIASGGILGIKRRLHEAVGGFDEDLQAHEDTYYSVKIYLLGIKLHYVPNAVMHVRFRSSFRDIYKQAHSYGYYYTLIYKKCRALGMPKEPTRWSEGLSIWKHLIRTLPRIRRRDDAIKVAFTLGYRVGRLKGSILNQIVLI